MEWIECVVFKWVVLINMYVDLDYEIVVVEIVDYIDFVYDGMCLMFDV